LKWSANGRSQLTAREKIFIENYINTGFNKIRAAKLTGYGFNTKNDNSMNHAAWVLTRKPVVRYHLEKRVKELAESIGFDSKYALMKLKKGLDYSIHDNPDERELDVRAGVACIAERNKMLGDYAKAENDTTSSILDQARNDIEAIKLQKPDS